MSRTCFCVLFVDAATTKCDRHNLRSIVVCKVSFTDIGACNRFQVSFPRTPERERFSHDDFGDAAILLDCLAKLVRTDDGLLKQVGGSCDDDPSIAHRPWGTNTSLCLRFPIIAM